MTLERLIAATRKAVTDLDRQLRELRHELQCAQAEICDLRDRLDALEMSVTDRRNGATDVRRNGATNIVCSASFRSNANRCQGF